jgi:hypothetical protein
MPLWGSALLWLFITTAIGLSVAVSSGIGRPVRGLSTMPSIGSGVGSGVYSTTGGGISEGLGLGAGGIIAVRAAPCTISSFGLKSRTVITIVTIIVTIPTEDMVSIHI